jgi:hypothetical protein
VALAGAAARVARTESAMRADIRTFMAASPSKSRSPLWHLSTQALRSTRPRGWRAQRVVICVDQLPCGHAKFFLLPPAELSLGMAGEVQRPMGRPGRSGRDPGGSIVPAPPRVSGPRRLAGPPSPASPPPPPASAPSAPSP